MSGVHQPTTGQIYFKGKITTIDSPRSAIDSGIATVYRENYMLQVQNVL